MLLTASRMSQDPTSTGPQPTPKEAFFFLTILSNLKSKPDVSNNISGARRCLVAGQFGFDEEYEPCTLRQPYPDNSTRKRRPQVGTFCMRCSCTVC